MYKFEKIVDFLKIAIWKQLYFHDMQFHMFYLTVDNSTIIMKAINSTR